MAIDKSWGHAYIGHDENLSQYIVDPEDQFLKNFIRSENHLMIYERIEVVDSDERVTKLEQQHEESSKHMKMLEDVLSQMYDIRVDNVIKEKEIEKLQLQLKKRLKK